MVFDDTFSPHESFWGKTPPTNNVSLTNNTFIQKYIIYVRTSLELNYHNVHLLGGPSASRQEAIESGRESILNMDDLQAYCYAFSYDFVHNLAIFASMTDPIDRHTIEQNIYNPNTGCLVLGYQGERAFDCNRIRFINDADYAKMTQFVQYIPSDIQSTVTIYSPHHEILTNLPKKIPSVDHYNPFTQVHSFRDCYTRFSDLTEKTLPKYSRLGRTKYFNYDEHLTIIGAEILFTLLREKSFEDILLLAMDDSFSLYNYLQENSLKLPCSTLKNQEDIITLAWQYTQAILYPYCARYELTFLSKKDWIYDDTGKGFIPIPLSRSSQPKIYISNNHLHTFSNIKIEDHTLSTERSYHRNNYYFPDLLSIADNEVRYITPDSVTDMHRRSFNTDAHDSFAFKSKWDGWATCDNEIILSAQPQTLRDMSIFSPQDIETVRLNFKFNRSMVSQPEDMTYLLGFRNGYAITIPVFTPNFQILELNISHQDVRKFVLETIVFDLISQLPDNVALLLVGDDFDDMPQSRHNVLREEQLGHSHYLEHTTGSIQTLEDLHNRYSHLIIVIEKYSNYAANRSYVQNIAAKYKSKRSIIMGDSFGNFTQYSIRKRSNQREKTFALTHKDFHEPLAVQF